jgi:hypothetical protein
MKMQHRISFLATALLLFFAGCGSLPPFKIAIDSDPPGARIEVNGEYIGVAPTTYTVRGNDDRSFNGSWVQGGDIVFTATPPHDQTNLYVQKKAFSPSAFFKQGDHIPEKMLFDMHVKSDASRDNLIQIDVNSK